MSQEDPGQDPHAATDGTDGAKKKKRGFWGWLTGRDGAPDAASSAEAGQETATEQDAAAAPAAVTGEQTVTADATAGSAASAGADTPADVTATAHTLQPAPASTLPHDAASAPETTDAISIPGAPAQEMAHDQATTEETAAPEATAQDGGAHASATQDTSSRDSQGQDSATPDSGNLETATGNSADQARALQDRAAEMAAPLPAALSQAERGPVEPEPAPQTAAPQQPVTQDVAPPAQAATAAAPEAPTAPELKGPVPPAAETAATAARPLQEQGPVATAAEDAPPASEPGIAEPPAPDTPAPAVAETVEDAPAPAKKGFWARLTSGLARTASSLGQGITDLVSKRKLDADTLEDLEDILIRADLGVETAGRIVEAVGKGRHDKMISPGEVKGLIAAEVERILEPVAKPLVVDHLKRPFVVLMVGVNGSGKTTTIGKLAAQWRHEGKKVVLAAGDTFRAAAIDQLKVWGQRTGTKVIAKEPGADAAGVAHDALTEAKADGADILMIDTAGRLQNRTELMAELEKIVRVVKKLEPSAPHAVLLVLDATVGQNALSQVEAFSRIAGVTGLVMTKLDGTARGGILVAIAAKHRLPVHLIGVGEGADDLQPFTAKDFARAIAGLD